MAYLHACESHETILNAAPTTYLSIDIKPNVFNDLKEETLVKSILHAPDAKFLVLKMYRELLQNDPHSADLVQMLFYQFAGLLTLIDKKKMPHWMNIIHSS